VHVVINLDPITVIDTMLDGGADIWETAISAACEDEQDMAARRWRLGDIALRVQKAYGKNRLGDFAKQINVPVPTVRQYRHMSEFYPNDTRYCFENVGYSHYRAAIGLKELDAALELLTVCANESATVEDTLVKISKIKGKPTSPRKLLDAEDARIIDLDMRTGRLVLEIGRGADLSALCDMNEVHVKLYQCKDAA
jgi:hypothetical protein